VTSIHEVTAGRDPAIHVFAAPNVDGRVKRGHDEADHLDLKTNLAAAIFP
jgi:hypothetical protein